MCAIVDTELGNYEEAEALLKKAISALKPSTIGPFEEFVFLLAKLYDKQGKAKEADSFFKMAMLTFLQREGRLLRTATCLKDYSHFLQEHGQAKAATKLDAQAGVFETNASAIEQDERLPNNQQYQHVMYPVTIFH